MADSNRENVNMKMNDGVARERELRKQRLVELRGQMIDVSGDIACLLRMRTRISECLDSLHKGGCTMPVLASTLATVSMALAQAEARYKHLDEAFQQVTVGESYDWIVVRGVMRGLPH